MIKDVMVWLDGSLADEVRLEAAAAIARQFDSQIVALLLNPLPLPAQILEGISRTEQLEFAREIGDKAEVKIDRRLKLAARPVEIRRFDVLADDIANIASREARSADTFVALRPNGAMDPDRLVEGVLFGSGRHIYLFPETERPVPAFDRILVAWNGSRESARAMTEAMPFLRQAQQVTVAFVTDKPPAEEGVPVGTEAVIHLKHHGIHAEVRHIASRNGDVGAALLAEARKADLLVMGGYGHPRLREWLLGGVTYNLMHEAPVPILMAH